MTAGRTKTVVKRLSHSYSAQSRHGSDYSYLDDDYSYKTTLNLDGIVTTGDSVPDWRKAIESRSSATSGLEGFRYVVTGGNGRFRRYRYLTDAARFEDAVSDGILLAGIIQPPSISDVHFYPDPTAAAMASSKLLGSVIKAKTQWRGGNFLAEVTETYHSLRHPLESSVRTFNKFVKNVAGIRKLSTKPIAYSKALGDLWLKYSFEAKPLMEDAKDAGEALASLTTRGLSDGLPVSGWAVNPSVSKPEINPWSPHFGAAGWFYESHTETTSQVKYYGMIKATPPGFQNALQGFGLDVYDIVPAVWEAVPWSFFVDYFVNVNEMLDSMRYWSAEVSWLNRAVKNSVTNIYSSVQGEYLHDGYYQLGGTHSARAGAEYVNRIKLTTLPYPGWQFKCPGLGSVKVVNIAALITGIKKSRP